MQPSLDITTDQAIEQAPEGLSAAGELPLDAPDLVPLPVGKAARLSQLAADYAFFTFGIMICYTPCWLSPLWDYLQEAKEPFRYYSHRFRRPLFVGLEFPNGDADWNHVLFAVQRPHWEGLKAFLTSTGICDTPARRYAQIRAQDLTIVDPLFADRAAVWPVLPPTVEITSFGLSTIEGQICLASDIALGSLPRVTAGPADPDIQTFAQALFAGQNPHHVLEAEKHGGFHG